MKKFKLVVLTNAKEGCDNEFNDWYNNQHLKDVVAVPGFISAQRFVLTNPMGFDHSHRYLAIYDIESDDPDGVVAEMLRRRDTPAMVINESLDLANALAGVFEVCSPLVKSWH